MIHKIRNILGQVKAILKDYLKTVPPEYKEEFNYGLLKTNIYRIKIIAIFCIIGLLLPFYFDFLNFQNGSWMNEPAYRFLFYTHVMLVLVALIPLVVIPMIQSGSRRKRYLWETIGYISFVTGFLVNTMLVSIVDQKIHGEVTIYVLGALVLAVFVYLKPITSFVTYASTYVLFWMAISIMQNDNPVLYAHYVNCTILITSSWIISVTLFQTRLRDFVNNKRLEYYANYDYLTGCLNRRAFISRLEGEIERARRDQSSVSVLLVDVDYFKQINDRFGHAVGDVVLKRLVECISDSCRSYDFIGRFGGEEFIICLPNTNISVAYEIAERLRCCVEETTITFGVNSINITVSMGAAVLGPAVEESFDQLITRADSAMYKAKVKRNNVCMY